MKKRLSIIFFIIMYTSLILLMCNDFNVDAATFTFSGEIINAKSNYRDYNWYYDQGNSGAFSNDNCAPAVATMAIKWCNKDFNKTVEDARNSCLKNGGWWSVNDIISYMFNNGVDSYILPYKYDKNQIKEVIDDGNILILALNTLSFTDYLNNESANGKFYYGSTGHAIIVKGYIETTTDFYLDTYDPNSLGKTYSDGMLIGKVRYYSLEDINNGVGKLWNYIIVVQKPSDN